LFADARSAFALAAGLACCAAAAFRWSAARWILGGLLALAALHALGLVLAARAAGADKDKEG